MLSDNNQFTVTRFIQIKKGNITMTRRPTTGIMIIVLMFMLVLGAFPASAAPDRTPPTTPTNFRVTGTTAYSVSLAWNPSRDNSGQFSYVICCAYNNMMTVPQTATTAVFTAGLEAGRVFSFQILAKDVAGNYSKASNRVTVSLPADTQAPTKPAVSVTGIGPTNVALQLSSVENGPHVWYTVFKNGTPVIFESENASPIITPLQPGTTYTFTVQAKDFAGLLSPLSDPVTVTTAPSNPNDTIPPTTPNNLSGMNFGEETWLNWGQSTDNLTQQSLIQYEIYANGVLDHTLVGRGETVLYGTAGMVNTFEVIAVDSAGNKSAPATFTVDIP
jgi:chitodextrinase